MNVLHVIHDFLPRHRAGSEIYAFELCRAQSARHHVTVLAAEYDPARAHGTVTWRLQDQLSVVELVNNWQCANFQETYRPRVIGEQIGHVLDAVQPDVVHVHSLLNLSFELVTAARTRGAAIVATLHDYTLVCPSGGQRFHRADEHLCDRIEPARCARCFAESPFAAQMSASVATASAMPAFARRAAMAVHRRWPGLTHAAVTAIQHARPVSVTPMEIEQRLQAAVAVFDSLDLAIAPSHAIAAEFERLGCDGSRIRVSDYGFAPLAGFTPGREPLDVSSPLRIGYVGTLVWHKGVHVLLDAISELPDHRYEVLIFGDPTTFPDYAADLARRAASRPVRFMGGFDRDRVAEVYAAIDVLVVPSLWIENSPLVIHEAFQAGVPVVGARSGGIAELVVHGTSGLLYNPASPTELAAVLSSLIEDRERLDALRRGVPAVKSIEQDALEWESAYGDVVGRRQAVLST